MIEWKPALELGVPEIDADHRALVDMLNRVLVAEDREEAMVVLEELEDYTHYHFAREEALMAECGFEFTREHTREHRALYLEVRNQIDDLLSGERSLREIAQFMQRWLLRHIAGADRLLGASIRKHRLTVAEQAGG